MNNKKPHNPPAFPRPIGEMKQVGAGHWSDSQQGMTLRDWFAGQALQGVLSNDTLRDALASKDSKQGSQRIAEACYGIADYMLAEREKQES